MTSEKKRLVAIEDLHPSKDQLLRVEWNLGKRCNFDCSYCSPHTHDRTSPHLDWETIEKTLKKLREISLRDRKKVKIGFTGGEPYLHPRFSDILKLAKELGIERISVTTNGSLHSKTYIDSMEYVDFLIFSYHLEYARKEKVLQNILDLSAFLKEFSPNKHKQIYVHLMVLPGHLEEVAMVLEKLKAAEVNLSLRRIRPQYDQEGNLLKPYASGQLGQPHPRKDLRESYYSHDEIKQMAGLL